MSSEIQTSLENDELVERIELDSGNFVVRNETGGVKFYLKGDRELFGLDAGIVTFERKALLAVMQIYLLAFRHGRDQERALLNGKIASALHLVFDE